MTMLDIDNEYRAAACPRRTGNWFRNVGGEGLRCAGYTSADRIDDRRIQTMSIEVTAISLGALGVRLFGDVGVSRSALGRLGLREAIRSARRAEYDVLIVEHVDRISKDLVDIVDVFEILCDLRIRIYAVHGGYLDLDTLSSCDVPPLYDRLPLRARRRTSRPRTIMGAES